MLAASLGLRDRVTFLGQASDVDLRRWFRTATVYVSMSGHEAFGITLFEALAAGAGIVASDIPAHREVAAAAEGHVKLVGAHATPMALAALMREAAEGQAQTSSLPDIPRWAAVVERTEAIYFSAMHAAIPHV
jgi:glycosyltransferase involved in cell wall biosynthesis